METLENDPEPLVTILASTVWSKESFTVALAENPLPETNIWVVGGPAFGEMAMDWLKAEIASEKNPINKQQSPLRLSRQVMSDWCMISPKPGKK